MSDPLPDALRAALGDVLRAEYERDPELLERVRTVRGAAKGGTKRVNPADFTTERYLAARHECSWCGDWYFVTRGEGRKNAQTCSPDCSVEYRRYLRRRAA